MKIAYSGHRNIDDFDLDILRGRVVNDLMANDVEELFFGGAVGIDSHALRFAYLARAVRRTPRLVVVCPDTLSALPQLAKVWAEKYADSFVELNNPITATDGYMSYELRNRWMVDQIRDLGVLEAFWSGRKPSGTWNAIRYAIQIGACWEHIPIRGSVP